MKSYEATSSITGKTYKVESPDIRTIEEIQARIYFKELNDDDNYRFPKGLNPANYTSEVTKEDISSFQQFMYNFDKAETDLGLFSTWLEADMPLLDETLAVLPGIESGSQKYGTDFLGLSPEEKRARIEEAKEMELQRDYPEIYAAGVQDEGGVAGGFGTFFGALASPTTAVPIGATTKIGAVGVGALLGGTYGVLGEKARSTEIDFGNVATTAALGGGLGLGGHLLVKAVQNKLKPKATEKDVAESGQVVDDVNQELVDDVVKETYQADTYFSTTYGKTVTILPANASAKEVARAHRKYLLTGEPYEVAKSPLSKVERAEQRVGKSKEEILAASAESGKPIVQPSSVEAKVVGNVTDEGITPVTRATNGVLSRYIESLSTQVGRISPAIQLQLRKVDMWTHAKVWERQQRVKPFTKFWNGGVFTKSISREDKELVSSYLYNGNFESAEKVISKYGKENVEHFKEVSKLYDEMFEELKTGYPNINKRDNFWHRSIKDWDGLQKALGKEETDIFQELLKKETARLRAAGKLGKQESLPKKERIRVFNNYFRGNIGNLIRERTLTAAQKRRLQSLDKELIKYYDDPIVALHKYIDEGTYDHARKVFFGKAGKVTGEGTFSTENSVGALIENMARKGEVTPQQADELAELLKIRFINGERTASGLVQGFRNAGYLTTLANPFSAAIQLADVGVSAYTNGLRNTLASMVSPKQVSMKELGLDRVLAEEFRNEKVLAKTLHAAFTASGFRQIDRFGKDVVLNAALRKGRLGALKRDSKFGRKLDSKYKETFGEEYQALINELKAGQMTERVKMYLWSELADVQPVSLSEMPVNYLEMRNGRLLYMLKTWTAKQLDLMRRDIRDQWANGNKKQAVSNAISYSLIIPSFGVGASYVKDSMLGRDPDLDEIEPRYIDAALKMFGASEYLLQKTLAEDKAGDKLTTAARAFLPPYKHITDTVTELDKALRKDDPEWSRVIRHAPIVGRFYYNFYGGGLENYEAFKDSRN